MKNSFLQAKRGGNLDSLFKTVYAGDTKSIQKKANTSIDLLKILLYVQIGLIGFLLLTIMFFGGAIGFLGFSGTVALSGLIFVITLVFLVISAGIIFFLIKHLSKAKEIFNNLLEINKLNEILYLILMILNALAILQVLIHITIFSVLVNIPIYGLKGYCWFTLYDLTKKAKLTDSWN